MEGRMDGRMGGRTDGWTHGRKVEWTDGRTDTTTTQKRRVMTVRNGAEICKASLDSLRNDAGFGICQASLDIV